jgi:hypothetical protein
MIQFLAPYASNVEALNKGMKSAAYARELQGCPPAATIDSYQGRWVIPKTV